MYYDKYFPFLRKSPLIKRHVTEVQMKDIFMGDMKKKTIASNEVIDHFMLSRRPKVIFIKPLNVMVMNESTAVASWYKKHIKVLKCVVHEVDYFQIAKDIDVEGKQAFYQITNGSEITDISIDEFVNLAANGKEIRDVESIYMGNDGMFENIDPFDVVELKNKSIEQLNEEGRDFSKYAQGSASVDDEEVQSPLERRLESYLLGGYTNERVPLLLGPSAVAKSATVKMLAKKHNMRLVDLRVSFMTRLDFEGLMEKVDTGLGEFESYNAPMEDIVEVTDDFIYFARTAVPKVEARIEALRSEGADAEKIKGLEKVLEMYKEKAKIPILFFDEVTRSDASIRNALMKILNEKTFMGMDMKFARIIGATNFPVGLPPEMRDLYLADEGEDVAFLDRFEPLQIEPSTMERSWDKWAEMTDDTGQQNIHPSILAFLSINAGKKYDYNEVIAKFEESDEFDELFTTPFPNYRTWEILTRYVRKLEAANKVVSMDTVSGLIGPYTAGLYVDYLVENYGYTIKQVEEKHRFDDVVSEGMANNVPTMIIGPSSIGKTTRIKNEAMKIGAEVIEINLAMQDRVDIMGPPVKTTVMNHIAGDTSELDFELTEELKGLLAESEVPEKLTKKAPKSNVKRRIEKAVEEGRPVVLFFDELNRVTNEALMAAVFEAVSDNRIFGITFDPNLVRIFAACNLGESTEDAKDLDPAFAARFNMYRKHGYEESDADSFIEYIERKKYNPYLVEWAKSLSKEEVVEMISSIEERTLETAVPSLRAFADLNRLVNSEHNAQHMKGTILFSKTSTKQDYSDLVMSSRDDQSMYQKAVEIDQEIKPLLNNWSAIESGFKARIGSEEIGVAELIQDYKELSADLFSDDIPFEEKEQNIRAFKQMIKLIYQVDYKIAEDRKQIFEMGIGHKAREFADFYNSVSGTDSVEVEIEDLKDETLIRPFFDKKLITFKSPNDVINAVVGYGAEFLAVHGDTLPQKNYQMYITEAMESLTNTDSKLNLVKSLALSRETEKVIKYAEMKSDSTDKEFVKRIFNEMGIPVSEEDIEEFEKQKQSSPERRSRIL